MAQSLPPDRNHTQKASSRLYFLRGAAARQARGGVEKQAPTATRVKAPQDAALTRLRRRGGPPVTADRVLEGLDGVAAGTREPEPAGSASALSALGAGAASPSGAAALRGAGGGVRAAPTGAGNCPPASSATVRPRGSAGNVRVATTGGDWSLHFDIPLPQQTGRGDARPSSRRRVLVGNDAARPLASLSEPGGAAALALGLDDLFLPRRRAALLALSEAYERVRRWALPGLGRGSEAIRRGDAAC